MEFFSLKNLIKKSWSAKFVSVPPPQTRRQVSAYVCLRPSLKKKRWDFKVGVYIPKSKQTMRSQSCINIKQRRLFKKQFWEVGIQRYLAMGQFNMFQSVSRLFLRCSDV